jgi:hypothetical protein
MQIRRRQKPIERRMKIVGEGVEDFTDEEELSLLVGLEGSR